MVGISGLMDACLRQASRSADFESLLQYSQQYLIYHLVMAKSAFHVDGVIPNSQYILSKLLESGVTLSPGPHDQRSMGKERTSSFAFSRGLSSGNQDSDSCTAPVSSSTSFGRELDEIDPLQGFSNRLLLLINDICDLRDLNTSEDGDSESSETMSEYTVIQIQSRLNALIQLPPRNSRQSLGESDAGLNDTLALTDPERDRLDLIMKTAEANRLAALLFLDETCATHLPHVIPQCRKNRAHHIQSILTTVRSICDTGQITAALPIWPAFLAGCLASNDDTRLQVMEIFDKFERISGFGVSETDLLIYKIEGENPYTNRIIQSLPPAIAVVQMVWRQSDLGFDENPRGVASSASLHLSSIEDNTRKNHQSGLSAINTGRARYPWERVVPMIKGSLISLT